MTGALLLSALATGFLGSTHCVVMCGGVVATTCSALPLQRGARWRTHMPYVLSYNGGRIASYSAAESCAINRLLRASVGRGDWSPPARRHSAGGSVRRRIAVQDA